MCTPLIPGICSVLRSISVSIIATFSNLTLPKKTEILSVIKDGDH